MNISTTPAEMFLPDSPTPRSKGQHLSGIIRCMAVEVGKLKPEYVDEMDMMDHAITDPVAILRMSIGLAWEDWYIKHILHPQGVVKHPGELKLNNVYMTPDGESIECNDYTGNTNQLVIHEVKATYKSLKTVGNFSQQWLWLTQAKGYCHAAKTRFAKFHVLMLCGDYKFPIKPVKQCWWIEFSEKELKDNWSMLMEYHDYRRKL